LLGGLLVGCTKNPNPNAQPSPTEDDQKPKGNVVTGKVLFEDGPVTIGGVAFCDKNDNVVGGSVILPDGTFTVTGIPEGDYKAAVSVRSVQVRDDPYPWEAAIPLPPGQPPQGAPNGPGQVRPGVPPNGPPGVPPGVPPKGPPGVPPNGPPGVPPNGPPGGPPDMSRPHMPKGMPLPWITTAVKAKYDRIDPKYATPATTPLRVTVGKGTTNLDPWQLEASASAAPDKPAPGNQNDKDKK
jgi:hypothetical protein